MSGDVSASSSLKTEELSSKSQNSEVPTVRDLLVSEIAAHLLGGVQCRVFVKIRQLEAEAWHQTQRHLNFTFQTQKSMKTVVQNCPVGADLPWLGEQGMQMAREQN